MLSIRWAGLAAVALTTVSVTCAPSSPPATPAPPEPLPAMAAAPFRFNTCKEAELTLDYLAALAAIPDGSLEEQTEQLRDWIWWSLLARVAKQKGTSVLTSSVLDLPTFRLDGLPDVLHGPSGSTRTTVATDGEVLVLVDQSTSADIEARALDAIDEQAMRLGHMPENATVYGYVLNPSVAKAVICKPQQLTRNELESAQRGYRAKTVKSQAELAQFLDGGVDLLSAQCVEGGVALSGRHRDRTSGAPMTAQHVAALTRPMMSPSTFGQLGFSLDPQANQFDAAGAESDLRQVVQALDRNGLDALFSGWNLESVLQQKLHAVAASRLNHATFKLELEHLAESLHAEGTSPENAIEHGLLARPQAIGVVAEALLARHSRQCARYDGPFVGTETGMTLFYTDLLAKFWAQNWRGAAPEGMVRGFRSEPHQLISTAGCKPPGYESGRLWFGLRPEGILVAPSGAVSFGPRSARLFGKAAGAGGEVEFEEPATRAYIAWWDRHYSDVAEWEPQYELLNQLMKWTSFLSAGAKPKACLAPLVAPIPVEAQRIDRWMASKQGLRFHGPLAVTVGNAGTECLPKYASETYEHCGGIAFFSGGVSLAQPAEVRSRGGVPDLPVLARQLEPTVRPVAATSQGLRYTLLDRPDARLQDVRIEDTKTGVLADLNFQSKRAPRGVAQAWSFPTQGTSSVHRAVDLDGGKLRSLQTLHSFGAGELVVDRFDGAEVVLDARSGLLQSSQTVAQRILKARLQDKTFEQAVRAEFPNGPVELLAPDRAQLAFSQDGAPSNYAVLSTSAGEGFGFTLGIPMETERTLRVASRGNVRSLVVSVALHGRDASEFRSTATAMPTTSPRTALEEANRQGQWEVAVRLLEELRNADPGQWFAAEPQLRIAGALARRAGGPSPELERQELSWALARPADRTALTTPAELAELLAHAAIYAPADFRLTAELPPIAYPYSSDVGPDRFVSRVVDTSLPGLPQELKYGDSRLRLVRAPSGDASDASAYGSAYRLATGYRFRVVMVDHCSDETHALPACHCVNGESGGRRCDEGSALALR